MGVNGNRLFNKTADFFEVLVKLCQWILQLVSLFATVYIGALGIYELFIALQNRVNDYIVMKKIFHALELLFVAPVPALIVYQIRRVILGFFPTPSKDPRTEQSFGRSLSAEMTKTLFIASIIGVISTIILGKCIDVIVLEKSEGADGFDQAMGPQLSNDVRFTLIVALVFMIILIFFYYLVSHHKGEEKDPSKENSSHNRRTED